MLGSDGSAQIILGDRIAFARSPLARLRGLLGRVGLEPGEGLLLRPCNGVHTWGMKFSIDVVFLDAGGNVLRVERAMRPGRMVPWVRRAKQALELPAGATTAIGLDVGARLAIEECG
ncbi:MAG: DUF192 domain-containing protein [Dehalococcoidia bacterium]|nr:MAG: DUF192 domain-containing protein [Dehalococcoidia bacterium]